MTHTSPPTVQSRSLPPLVQRLVLALMALGLVLGGSLAAAPEAYAAGEQINHFDAKYAVQPDGKIKVTETFDWQFDSASHHGIKRSLTSRESYDKDQDMVYEYSDISVSSPTGASTELKKNTVRGSSSSDEELQLQIGSANQTVDQSETYVISYTVSGGLRSSPDYAEFYWDANGFGMPAVQSTTITATVPGGAKELSCFAGPVRSTNPCTTHEVSSDGTVKINQNALPAQQNVSFGIKIDPSQVSDAKPILMPKGSSVTTGTRNLAVGAGAASVVVSAVLGLLFHRSRRDRRFVGLPPGVMPLKGAPAPVGPSGKENIPVAFAPPPIPVAQAGLLMDGRVDVKDTTATMIDLAVRGCITLSAEDAQGRNYQATLQRPQLATLPHEVALLQYLFDGRPPGATVSLGERGEMTAAHQAFARRVAMEVQQLGWYDKQPRAVQTNRRPGCSSVGYLFFFFAFGGSSLVSALTSGVFWFALPVIPLVVLAVYMWKVSGRGRRSATGRAICDQVDGFKEYLATAEANQLRFEEGEDIFSKYLPWAIIFGLADRWTKVCEDLVRMGRIPDLQPTWYVGNYHMFNVMMFNSAIGSSSMPMPAASSGGSMGSGFGGGSSFGGGGFSGGGGGGGGASSW